MWLIISIHHYVPVDIDRSSRTYTYNSKPVCKREDVADCYCSLTHKMKIHNGSVYFSIKSETNRRILLTYLFGILETKQKRWLAVQIPITNPIPFGSTKEVKRHLIEVLETDM